MTHGTGGPSQQGGFPPRSRFHLSSSPDTQGIGLAARLTFRGLADDPSSHYYRTGRLTPDETAEAVLVHVETTAVAVGLDAVGGGGPLGLEDIREIHEKIFRPVFGAQTLGMRAEGQQSYYGIVKGTRENPVLTSQMGTSPRGLRRKLERVLEGFEKERAEVVARGQSEELLLADAVRPAAKLYARLIGVHPYLDGNGRTGFCVLTHALIRCGTVGVALTESDDFHWCLGQGMRKDRAADFEPLTDYIADRIRSSA